MSQEQQDSRKGTTTLSDFKIINKLGEGAYSSVYKVLRLADTKEYALKKVKLLNLSEKERENAINEVRILASIKQKYVISYKEAFWDPEAQCLCIIMEYADNGDLFQKICEHQKKNTEFQEQEIWKVFIQIVRGLKSLHDLRIMHRDLKSANVFLYKDWTAKLGDMNVSKLANYKGLNYTQTGTPYYASPEVWKDEPYDSKSDIWSLGCVLYEMITLKPPFRADDMQGLYKRVLKGMYQKIPTQFSTDLSTVVTALLQTKPHLRPSCDQILEMPAVLKKIEKLLPDQQQIVEKSQLVSEIRVPKNLMYLTDKLPAANYDIYMTGKMYKNRSENKFKLPKLTNSMGLISTAQSSAQIEYQLPQIKKKNEQLPQLSNAQSNQQIQQQIDSMMINNQYSNQKNIQQSQVIIQLKGSQAKEKKSSSLVKVSSLNQQSSMKSQKEIPDYGMPQQQQLLSPSQQMKKDLLIPNLEQQQLSIQKPKKTLTQSQSSDRQTTAKKETKYSQDIIDQNKEQQSTQERISVITQKDMSEEVLDKLEDLPPPITSKSPVQKMMNQKLLSSRNHLLIQEEETKASTQLSAHIQKVNSALSELENPSQQLGYRYASLSPVKKLELEQVQNSYQSMLQRKQKLPPINSPTQDMKTEKYAEQQLGTRSQSPPYRNSSLIQPIQQKSDLQKLKHSLGAPKAQSSGKLPKLKGSESIIKVLSKNPYYMKVSPKMQNMYYRVANSYLKNHQPQMNVIGNSVKNQYNIYSGGQPSQIIMDGQNYYKAPLKPRYINQIQKIDMQKPGTKGQIMVKESLKAQQYNDISSSLIYPLLNSRPNAKHGQNSISIDINSRKLQLDDELPQTGSLNSPSYAYQEGMNLMLPRNNSQVLLKQQIVETKH